MNRDPEKGECSIMKFKVNQDTCIGCGLCEGTCPAVFHMTDAGVAEAMITTVFGLLIAIGTICFHTYFSQRVNTVLEEVEQMDNAFMENAGDMPREGGKRV